MVKRPKKHDISVEQLAAAEAQIVERSRRIEFFITEYTIEILVQKLERREFVIPDYQREYTWDETRKSRFIESLVMGLPVPFLFFWEMGDGRLEIVDGSQRLRTLQEYVLHDLDLAELEEIPALSGTRFSDLSPSRQLKIKNRSIRGIVLSEHADEQARFDMFERINTSSKVANTAEVRRGALRGPFLDMAIELSKLKLFTKLAPVSKKSLDERIPEELVTRFFAYGDGVEDYKDSPSLFIFNYTKAQNSRFIEDPSLVETYKARFTRMLEFVDKTFENGFTKIATAKSTPRARFEALSIGSDHALNLQPALFDAPPDVSGWLGSEEFRLITTSDAANVKSKLIKRFTYVTTKLTT